MPKVALLFEYSSLNGGENSQIANLSTIRDAGFQVVALASPEGDLAQALQRRDVQIVPWSAWNAADRRHAQPELRDHLRARLHQTKCDLVHANSLSMARLAGPVADEMNLPSIGHIRDIVRLSKRAIKDVNRNSRLLAVSRAARQFHVSAGLAGPKTYVVYNGVDVVQFCPRPMTKYLHRELEIDDQCPLIGSIGQIGMRKGLDDLLKAAVDVVRRMPNVHFLIAGQRHSSKQEAVGYEAELHARSQQAPLSGNVHFLGRRNDVHCLLNELTLLVHAARQEPLGRVLLEAGASGTPVIATNVGGTVEMFPPRSNTARLVNPEVCSELTDAILELIVDESQRERLSRAARQRIESKFDVTHTSREVVEHYRLVLNGQRPDRNGDA